MNDLKILPPSWCKFDEIQKNIVQEDTNFDITLTYPNGAIIRIIISDANTEVQTNFTLIDNGDGTFSVPEHIGS